MTIGGATGGLNAAQRVDDIVVFKWSPNAPSTTIGAQERWSPLDAGAPATNEPPDAGSPGERDAGSSSSSPKSDGGQGSTGTPAQKNPPSAIADQEAPVSDFGGEFTYRIGCAVTASAWPVLFCRSFCGLSAGVVARPMMEAVREVESQELPPRWQGRARSGTALPSRRARSVSRASCCACARRVAASTPRCAPNSASNRSADRARRAIAHRSSRRVRRHQSRLVRSNAVYSATDGQTPPVVYVFRRTASKA
jgi:hypothetical protein